jgi:hypothetical protein
MYNIEIEQKRNEILAIQKQVFEKGYNCNIYNRYTQKQIEFDYHSFMWTGCFVLASCTKINHIINPEYKLDYINEFQISENGLHFKPNYEKPKGTYIVIQGNDATYENQQYVRILLKQGYEVILHSVNHKYEPLTNKFTISTPVVGMLIKAHGHLEKGKHFFEFNHEYQNLDTLDFLTKFKNLYGDNISTKFELALLSCHSGVIKKEQIKTIIPQLNELYTSKNDKNIIFNEPTYDQKYNLIHKADTYNFGIDISPLSFFVFQDESLSINNDQHLYHHETGILGF